MREGRCEVKRAGTCVHFCGIQHEKCDAGVVLHSVRDASQPGPYRWPCLTLKPDAKATTTCDQYREPTAGEIAADKAAWDAWLEEMRQQTARGECSTCGEKATRAKQVGSCVYLEPCGHRVGQGDAKKVSQAMGLS
jgi:hypothetical protein